MWSKTGCQLILLHLVFPRLENERGSSPGYGPEIGQSASTGRPIYTCISRSVRL